MSEVPMYPSSRSIGHVPPFLGGFRDQGSGWGAGIVGPHTLSPAPGAGGACIRAGARQIYPPPPRAPPGERGVRERENSFLATYWSESTEST